MLSNVIFSASRLLPSSTKSAVMLDVSRGIVKFALRFGSHVQKFSSLLSCFSCSISKSPRYSLFTASAAVVVLVTPSAKFAINSSGSAKRPISLPLYSISRDKSTFLSTADLMTFARLKHVLLSLFERIFTVFISLLAFSSAISLLNSA